MDKRKFSEAVDIVLAAAVTGHSPSTTQLQNLDYAEKKLRDNFFNTQSKETEMLERERAK